MTDTEKEYATALFEIAEERGLEEEYSASLHTAADLIFSDGRYPQLLSVPSLASSVRVRLLRDAIADAVPRDVLSFLSLLTEKGRINMLSGCVDEYDILLREKQRTAEAVVTSAVALSDAQLDRLRAALERRTGKRITLRAEVDPSLIGGVSVRIGDSLFDGSLSGRLNDIRENISGR